MQNPFSTSAVLPGKLDFVFQNGMSLEALLNRFVELDYRAQIIGPHGSGKSTLIRNLCSRIDSASATDFEIISQDARELAAANRIPVLHFKAERCLLVIDGIEQLQPSLQTEFIAWTRAHEIAILCSCHRQISGLPVLWQTEPRLAVFEKLVEQLVVNASHGVNGESRSEITPQQIEEAFRLHAGNIREAFFELYDQVEMKRG